MKDCIEATSQIPRPQLKGLFSCTGHLSAATPLISFPPLLLSFLGLPQLSSLLPHHPLKARAYWGSSVWPSSCLEEFLSGMYDASLLWVQPCVGRWGHRDGKSVLVSARSS